MIHTRNGPARHDVWYRTPELTSGKLSEVLKRDSTVNVPGTRLTSVSTAGVHWTLESDTDSDRRKHEEGGCHERRAHWDDCKEEPPHL